jgi:hypothetical protein
MKKNQMVDLKVNMKIKDVVDASIQVLDTNTYINGPKCMNFKNH